MLLEERLDDEGFSGATLDRPALKRLVIVTTPELGCTTQDNLVLKPCGHKVAAQEIEMAVVGILRSRQHLNIDPKAIPDHVESVGYDHRDASITARLIRPPDANSLLTG